MFSNNVNKNQQCIILKEWPNSLTEQTGMWSMGTTMPENGHQHQNTGHGVTVMQVGQATVVNKFAPGNVPPTTAQASSCSNNTNNSHHNNTQQQQNGNNVVIVVTVRSQALHLHHNVITESSIKE